MIGSIIGAGVGAIGSIFGGMSAARAAREQKKRIQRSQTENASWYNRNYYEDPTKRASALAVLNRTEEGILQRNKAAAGRQAVMGGTDDSVTAAREANSAAAADATSRVVAANDARKDAVDAQYRQRKNELDDQLNGLAAQRANAIGGAVQGVSSAASSIGSLLDGGDGDRRNRDDSVTR